MNRAEIIQTLAMRAGMPQLEAGKFMEVFLRKLAALLVHGDAFFLSSFGSFEVVKPEQEAAGGADSIVIFRPDGDFGDDEQLVFRVPVASGEVSNQLDLYFSMGVDKPLIPLKGQKYTPDELPTSPLELRKYAEYKADAILNKGEVHRNAFGTEYSAIKKRYSKQESFSTGRSEPEKPANWEFGDDWKKEYEVESLLTSGDNEIVDEFPLESNSSDEASGWDFGGEDDAPPPVQNKKPAKKVDDDFTGLANPTPFNSFPPATKELEIDLSEFAEDEEEVDFDNIEQEAADFDSLFKKSLAENMLMAKPVEETVDDAYHRVRSTREIPDIHIPDGSEPAEPFDSAKFKSMIVDMKLGSANEEEGFSATGIKDTVEITPPRKESGAGKWYVLAFVLVTITGTLAYLKIYGLPFWADKFIKPKVDVVITSRVPVVIERDYAFPVTFPYPSQVLPKSKQISDATEEPESTEPAKPEKVVDEAIKAEMQRIEEQKKQQQQKIEDKPQQNTPVETKPAKVSEAVSKQVQKFIFADGSGFQVQVMSVKSQSIAESEAARLNNKGYKASVHTANIPGKGTWYRVRLGNYKTVEEAASVASKLNLR